MINKIDPVIVALQEVDFKTNRVGTHFDFTKHPADRHCKSMKYNFDEIISRGNTFSVKYDGKKAYFGSADLIPMWVADMDFKTPPFITEAVKKRADQPIYGYSFRPDSYYNSLIEWFERKHGWEIKKEWILFTPGIVPALNMLVQTFTMPGNKVLVQPPVYHPFFSAIENNHRQLVNNPLTFKDGEYLIDFNDLAAKLSSGTKLVLFSNPHNPVGRAWNKEELKKLADLCVQNDVIVISDEIHCDLVLPGNKHISLTSVSEEIKDQVVTCISPSKTFNLAGMSTSSLVIQNDRLREKFELTIEQLHLDLGNLFGTVASIAAYTHGDTWLKQLLDYINGNVDFVEDFLKKRIPEVEMVRPEATYLIWMDFSGLRMDPEDLKFFLINKAKVGFNDGRTFGEGGEGFQRMNVACPRKIVEEALIRIEKAINDL